MYDSWPEEVRKDGAGDGIRTRDINLGKVALYQLSYSRVAGNPIVSRADGGCQFQLFAIQRVTPKPLP